MVWYIVTAIVGAALLLLTGLGKLDSFWSGMGAALVAVSVVRILQIARYKRNEDYANELYVKNHDERNVWLSLKARSDAFCYSIILEAIGVIVFRIVQQPELSVLLGYLVCIQLVIYWLDWLVLKKKY